MCTKKVRSSPLDTVDTQNFTGYANFKRSDEPTRTYNLTIYGSWYYNFYGGYSYVKANFALARDYTTLISRSNDYHLHTAFSTVQGYVTFDARDVIELAEGIYRYRININIYYNGQGSYYCTASPA